MSEAAIGRFYDRFARIYDLIFDRVMHPGRVAAVDAMGLAPGQRVLEVGVGTGLNLPLYPRHVEIVGVDVSGAMLAKAQLRTRKLGLTNVRLEEMDACNLTLPDESFDHVYAPYVVSVVPDLGAVMSEMKRVCRGGGSIVIVNHFHSRNPLGAWFETTFTPLTHHMGFRMDLPARAVLREPDLDLQRNERVNLFGMWRLIILRKPDVKMTRPGTVRPPGPLAGPPAPAS
jgi:phosphatidylethanolamine/phosphatidyl-N-methylethanolamine N-methyltransferase